MLIALTLFTVVSLLVWMLVQTALLDNYEKEPKIQALSSSPGQPDRMPFLSVIVPARNEQDNISACLEALCGQDYPCFEVIVVDDRSEDSTQAIVQDFVRKDSRFHLIEGKPLPPGWAGKCHAIHQGVEMAKGEWLLMLDTDTFLEPRCLSLTVEDALFHKADLYTLLFEAQCVSFWERVVQPLFFQLMLMSLPLYRLNDPLRKEAAAPGPFLLFRRQAYDAIGGHEALKTETVEDLRLAQRIKETGHRLFMANAVSLVISRREIGLKEIWHGWSRVFYAGIRQSPFFAIAAFFGLGLFLLLPWGVPLYALFEIFSSGLSALPVVLLFLGLAHCLVFMSIRRLLRVFYRMDDSLSWLQPVAVLIVMAILVNSAWKESRGRTTWKWKGRSY